MTSWAVAPGEAEGSPALEVEVWGADFDCPALEGVLRVVARPSKRGGAPAKVRGRRRRDRGRVRLVFTVALTTAVIYRCVSAHAASLGVAIAPEELAELAVRHDMGTSEIAALNAVFAYLADKRHDQVIETLLRLSRLPQKAPKTFASFDFDRIRGRDAAALRKLPALANLHARKNLAFIGPGGIGKMHLAQAYGRECCLSGYKTYYLKATELRDKLGRAADSGNALRALSRAGEAIVPHSRRGGTSAFDKVCTGPIFFDVVDRRYERGLRQHDDIDQQHTHEQLGRVLHRRRHAAVHADRLFDRASVFVMKGASFRGAELEIFAVERRRWRSRRLPRWQQAEIDRNRNTLAYWRNYFDQDWRFISDLGVAELTRL